ncbi:MAG: NUDIX hydrolase [Symploca sp. SIO1A3]|nr:NUDIX hydrolase [Symploca sp. SIO1A3]
MNHKPSSYIEQSGVIPYRIREGNIEVLLITSINSKRWIIPKGMIEPGMIPQDSAAKEAWEEAGVIGEVLPTLIGTYDYPKQGSICRVEVFLMPVETVLEDWLEAQYRKRKWFSVEEAVECVREVQLKDILTTLHSLV